MCYVRVVKHQNFEFEGNPHCESRIDFFSTLFSMWAKLYFYWICQILAVPLIPPDPTKRAGDQALEKLINVVKITNSRAIISTRAYHSVVRASSISFLKTARLKWPDLPWIHSNHLSDSRYLGSKASETASYPWTSLVRKAVTKLAATSLGLNLYPSSGSQPSTPSGRWFMKGCL